MIAKDLWVKAKHGDNHTGTAALLLLLLSHFAAVNECGIVMEAQIAVTEPMKNHIPAGCTTGGSRCSRRHGLDAEHERRGDYCELKQYTGNNAKVDDGCRCPH